MALNPGNASAPAASIVLQKRRAIGTTGFQKWAMLAHHLKHEPRRLAAHPSWLTTRATIRRTITPTRPGLQGPFLTIPTGQHLFHSMQRTFKITIILSRNLPSLIARFILTCRLPAILSSHSLLALPPAIMLSRPLSRVIANLAQTCPLLTTPGHHRSLPLTSALPVLFSLHETSKLSTISLPQPILTTSTR